VLQNEILISGKMLQSRIYLLVTIQFPKNCLVLCENYRGQRSKRLVHETVGKPNW